MNWIKLPSLIIIGLMLLTLLPIGVINPTFNAAADDPIEVKIGFLNPLTGPIILYAPAFTDAGDLAIAHLNDGQSDYHFSLVERDSGCNGDTAATAAQSAIDAGVVGIAGAACSGATLGAIEVAKAAGVPMVSYASTSPAITNYDDDGYLFRVVPSDAQQGQALADTYEASGYTSPALISMTNDYGAGFANAFRDYYGGDICSEATYGDGTTDFTSQVTAVADNDCDSVVMITYASDGAAIAEEIAIWGLDVAIFGGDGIADVSFGNEFTDLSAINGITVTKPASGSDSSAKAAFDAAWEAEDRNASAIYIHETYDAVTMIGLAAMQDTDGDLRDDLAAVGNGYQGASGVHTFDAVGDVIGPGYEICQFLPIVVDGQPSLEFQCNEYWRLDIGIFSILPISSISSISPSPAEYNEEIVFNGDGTPGMYGNSIIEYRWISNIDGLLSSNSQFSTSSLSLGEHEISFLVQDDSGSWSAEQIFTLIVDVDSDGDGVPDWADAFPSDPSEWADNDGDGVGNVEDPFPSNPSEWADTDGDGIGDNSDDFPEDPNENDDNDGDGVGDNADQFDYNPGEWADSDGDGTGDNSDVFPNDPHEQFDTDGDGVGDNGDLFPSSGLISTWWQASLILLVLVALGIVGEYKYNQFTLSNRINNKMDMVRVKIAEFKEKGVNTDELEKILEKAENDMKKWN